MLTNEQIKEIEEKIHYTFKDKDWLNIAFTRRSYAEEAKMQTGEVILDNEQLEFYGDTVLKYSIVTVLPGLACFKVGNWDGTIHVRTEEELSNFISFWTDKTMLSTRIQELGLSKYLLMSKGDIEKKVHLSLSVMEDLFEAIIGAVWFDSEQDLRIVKNVVFTLLNISFESVCFQKNPYSILKEFIDKNDGYSVGISRTETGYKFQLANNKLSVHFTTHIKFEGNHNYHLAQAQGAKEAIEYLKDKGIWDGNKRIVSPNVTLLTAVNKLQELFQKKIIKTKPEYTAEYDYIYGEWIVTCKLGDGSVFSHSEISKVDAKKYAAMKAYDYILKNQSEIHKF